jgi:hypothetical protein
MAFKKTKTESTNTKEENASSRPSMTKQISSKIGNGAKAVLWLVETVARYLAGYVMLTSCLAASNGIVHNLVLVVGIYFTASATILVATHFFKAYK